MVLPKDKLESLVARANELDRLLCEPDAISDMTRYRKLMIERADLEGIVTGFERFVSLEKHLAEDREALADPELRAMVEEEIPELESQLAELEQSLTLLLLPADPHDARNTILEIRGGEGGDEATLFAQDLFRMYSRFADSRGWKMELISMSESSVGGVREVIAEISGNSVYSTLRFEGGVHRVQRVPQTEAQGRVHTSTATVAVLPEVDDVDIQIDPKDIRESVAASGGPGGQGVNTTNSAVQFLHIPTGLIVKCQDERSQHKNRARAMKVLRSRLYELEYNKRHAATSAERKSMVGGAERAEKVRTYNFPQNRVTDHRIGLTLYKLDRVISGALDELIVPLRTHFQAERLKAEFGIDLGLAPSRSSE
ncbi:MAG: peptide chain release factor 1 [Deltaproteobacteria bacterium]|nr:peptide chain release factor 1 [Deltaproteobacteria bacterium]